MWITYLTYLIGFSYAIAAGQLIKPIMDLMHSLLLSGEEKKHQWQPPITGILERTLYVASLLMDHAEFIGFWLALKIAIPYALWKKNQGGLGRAMYMGTVIGNGISILYAVVGYGFIIWAKGNKWFIAIIVPLILLSATLYLRYHLKSLSEKSKTHNHK